MRDIRGGGGGRVCRQPRWAAVRAASTSAGETAFLMGTGGVRANASASPGGHSCLGSSPRATLARLARRELEVGERCG